MFGFQCSVRRKLAGAAGCLPRMRVRQWWTGRQRRPQVPTYWITHSGWCRMIPRRKKSSAQLCTFPNMPTQANTSPAHAGRSPNMPTRSRTAVEAPSQKRKPLYERYLHRWIRSSFAFRGRRQAGLRRVPKGLKSNDLCTGRACREDQRFWKLCSNAQNLSPQGGWQGYDKSATQR